MSTSRIEVPPEESHLLDHLTFLRKRWRVVAGVFVGFVAAGAGLAYRADPTYEATVRVLVGVGSGKGVLSDRNSAIEGYLLEQRSFETQLEIMRSEPVVERAARTLGRIDDDTRPAMREAVIAALKGRTQVERVRDTRIVVLKVTHPDPEAARDIANAMAAGFIEYADEQRTAARRRSIEWLTTETGQVRDSLRDSESRLVDYISDEDLDLSVADASGDASGDPAEQALREQVASAEVELAQLRRRYRDQHPKIQDVEARLEGLRRSLDAKHAERAADHRKLIQYRLLKREVELDHDLYQVLLKKLKEADLETEVEESNIRILEAAKLPRSPVGPNGGRTLAVASVLGLCLGLGLAYGVETLDGTADSPDDVQRALGLPTLGVLRRFDAAAERPLVAEVPGSLHGESFRSLRTNVRFSHVDRPRRVVLVTSTGPEEGKSTVLANLGVSLAQSGRRTLVIDTDLRRPSLHRFFRIPEHRGLADLLAGDATLDEALRSSHIESLDVLPSGTRPPNPAELIESRRLQELIDSLRERYDYVLLDSPPAGGLIDSSLMCGLADGVLFVLERGRFDLKIVRGALRQLERAGGRIYGVVLNKSPVDDGSMLYGYYGYGLDVEAAASGSSAAGTA